MLPIIAIDGVSGSGKSSTARILSRELGFRHIDTGAMYRALTWRALREAIEPHRHEELGRLAASLEFSFAGDGGMLVNGEPLPDEIRSPEVSAHVSEYSRVGEVRDAMVEQQRRLGSSGPAVLEGRDIGTVVFPDARWKFFMTADAEARARRRVLELETGGMAAGHEEILKNLMERDEKDSGRERSPLRKAADAVEIDTSGLTLDEQVAIITRLVRRDLEGDGASRPSG